MTDSGIWIDWESRRWLVFTVRRSGFVLSWVTRFDGTLLRRFIAGLQSAFVPFVLSLTCQTLAPPVFLPCFQAGGAEGGDSWSVLCAPSSPLLFVSLWTCRWFCRLQTQSLFEMFMKSVHFIFIFPLEAFEFKNTNTNLNMENMKI